MEARSKTCLFCLKPRQILVDNPSTAKSITEIYNIQLPQDGCRICIECHFNIARVQEFKRTIENAADFDVDSCFVCKSENTVNEPGVDRVVDYLIKQCTTIDFGKTDTIKACVTCMHVLETSIKYEKMARNYATAQRFCKQYSTLKECNVALWKIDLDALGEICDDGVGSSAKKSKSKKNNKRARGSNGGDEGPAKKSKLEDGSVLPVMLTKLTPTGAKKASPPGSKGKGLKQSDKIFIKLPLFTKPKKKLQRKKFGPPHSPSRTIPATPSVDDLNKIFQVELRPLNIRIEHVDLSPYLNKTISHDAAIRQLRKPKKEEFIGLDEEDVVELQNTSMNSSISKRKSILITDRTESPNSAKKKVQFSDSPSIKYVDKIDFTDDENGTKDKSDDDEDYEVKKSKKRGPKPQNGALPSTPENGKPRPKGRPKKTSENGEDTEKEAADTANDSGAKGDNEDDTKNSEKVVAEDSVKNDADSSQQQEEQKAEGEEGKAFSEEKPEEEKKSDEHENPDTTSEPQPETPAEDEPAATEAVKTPPAEVPAAVAAMETEDADSSESMKVDQTDQAPVDAEMKAVDSPEDVEMTESKSPPTEDVEMKEAESTSPEPAETEKEPSLSNEAPQEPTEKIDQQADKPDECNSTKEEEPAADFETSDKEEEEMEKFKQTLTNILGEEISDSDQGLSQDGQENETTKPAEEKQHEEPEPAASSEPAEKEEQKAESQENTDPQPPAPANDSNKQPAGNESPEKKNQSFTSLDDVDDISDDDDILDQLDDDADVGRKRSPDLPPLGEDSL
ncbi:enolase-phosphatase E1-like [Aedes albopictus]|uniref:ZAD domain-containing protein n=1 Tax=Aedes albopictus TaxID=7160 RepID=A0ABM1YUU6_AEDAL